MAKFSRNDFRLSFLDEDYQVDEKTGVVLCALTFKLKAPENYFVYFGEDEELIDTTVGSATCCAEDKFNEEIGKKIARTKAENKAYRVVSKFLKKVCDSYSDAMMMSGVFQEKAKKYIKHNEEYLTKLEEKIEPKKKEVVKSNPVETYEKDFHGGHISYTRRILDEKEIQAEMERFETEFNDFMERFSTFKDLLRF